MDMAAKPLEDQDDTLFGLPEPYQSTPPSIAAKWEHEIVEEGTPILTRLLYRKCLEPLRMFNDRWAVCQTHNSSLLI